MRTEKSPSDQNDGTIGDYMGRVAAVNEAVYSPRGIDIGSEPKPDVPVLFLFAFFSY